MRTTAQKKEHIVKAQADIVLKIDLSNKRKTPLQKQSLKEGEKGGSICRRMCRGRLWCGRRGCEVFLEEMSLKSTRERECRGKELGGSAEWGPDFQQRAVDRLKRGWGSCYRSHCVLFLHLSELRRHRPGVRLVLNLRGRPLLPDSCRVTALDSNSA